MTVAGRTEVVAVVVGRASGLRVLEEAAAVFAWLRRRICGWAWVVR